jgi:hypothetical protein
MNKTALRPGILVSARTSIKGNCDYRKTTIQSEHTTPDGEQESIWETKRTIADPDEYERAKKARYEAGYPLRQLCVQTTFGLLCPQDNEAKLDEAVKAARVVVDRFNQTAAITRLKFNIICGFIADDDVEAVRAIGAEMQDLIVQMQEGIETVDAKGIREAANRAQALGKMLTPEAATKVQGVVETARAVAKRIVKAGEQAGVMVDREAIKSLEEARTLFVGDDEAMDDKVQVAAEEDARAIDLEVTDIPVPVLVAPESVITLELE